MADLLRGPHTGDRPAEGNGPLTVDVTDRIRADDAAGRTAFGLYLIPGFPDWESSCAAVAEAARAGVSFVEFPVLARPSWSSGTGSVIARALERAAPGLARWSPPLADWLADVECRVGVVYKAAWPASDRWAASPEELRASSCLLLEDDPPDWTAYARQADEWGAPLVCAVSGSDAECSDAERAKLAAGGGFVYVSLGQRTGERSAGASAMSSKVEAIREVRPDLPVCCAFGIREPGDVLEIRDATGCDGVIVGTAALEVLEEGVDRFRVWLGEMLAAASAPAAR